MMEIKTFRRLLGVCFILGPLLTLAASLIWLFGIGVNPGIMAWGSYIEGLVGYFGYILLVPVFLALCYSLARFYPRFAGFVAVLALIGFAGGGVMNMALRVIIQDFVRVGVTNETFDAIVKNYETGDSLMLIQILTGPFGPLASVLLGTGFLTAKVWRLRGVALLLAGILFMSGQLFQVAPEIGYPLGNAVWAIILIPQGVRILSGKEAITGQPDLAT